MMHALSFSFAGGGKEGGSRSRPFPPLVASHAAALGISAFAYAYARRNAGDPRFSFGTGKVNAPGGFAGAVLLALFAALMAWESLRRLLHPAAIAFDQANFVAVIGLIVNGASVFILGAGRDHHAATADPHDSHHHDHNLRSAYLHVPADALTSILAIGAFLGAKYSGLRWMDPAEGMVGAARPTGPRARAGEDQAEHRSGRRQPRSGSSRLVDRSRHLRGGFTVVAHAPSPAEAYKARLPRGLGIVHASVEVTRCTGNGAR